MPPTTLVDVLRERASERPDEVLFTYLVDGADDEQHLRFGELERRARAIAAALSDRVRPGDRVLLVYPPDLDFVAGFFGCLYAGAVPTPAYPPDPARLARTLPRLRQIAADAGAAAVLSVRSGLGLRDLEPAGELARLPWIASDAVEPGAAAHWKEPALRETATALLQYTSGSTGAPKGVRLTHRNLLHNEAMIRDAFEHDADSIVVGWLPLFHDMGLIGNVLQPLYMGIRCILMSPVAFLQRPRRWLRAISRYRATTSGGPNFGYELCVRRIPASQRAGLDLSSWSLAFNGSERVAPQTLERFSEAFGPCGFRPEAFYPCYGLAEASLIVTGGAKARPPLSLRVDKKALERGAAVPAAPAAPNAVALVGCGRARLDEEIRVVDPETHRPRGEGEVGEIWVRGASVAAGYWGRPEETRHTFAARPAGSDGATPARYLRTGDLGFQRNGELYVVGRIKDAIIIRGRNHHPEDIERSVVESHPQLRAGCGAAFSVDVDGEERLVVVQEIARDAELDAGAALGRLREAVTRDHGLSVHAAALIAAGTIPKTSSGKIQRRACRAAYLEGRLDVRACWPRDRGPRNGGRPSDST